MQPDIGFADDNNHFRNTLAEESHIDLNDDLPEQKVILPDGTDETSLC